MQKLKTALAGAIALVAVATSAGFAATPSPVSTAQHLRALESRLSSASDAAAEFASWSLADQRAYVTLTDIVSWTQTHTPVTTFAPVCDDVDPCRDTVDEVDAQPVAAPVAGTSNSVPAEECAAWDKTLVGNNLFGMKMIEYRVRVDFCRHWETAINATVLTVYSAEGLGSAYFFGWRFTGDQELEMYTPNRQSGWTGEYLGAFEREITILAFGGICCESRVAKVHVDISPRAGAVGHGEFV